ncbi:MAG: hypothetical protein V7731_22580 [Amphritea sp.]
MNIGKSDYGRLLSGSFWQIATNGRCSLKRPFFIIVADLPDVSAHFGRLRVTEISLSNSALKQFDEEPFVEASRLLADARVEAIVWSGTAAGWRGFEHDDAICKAIHQATGIEATTSVLALNDAFDKQGVKSFGLVTPYLHDVQEKIMPRRDTTVLPNVI